MAFVCEPTPAKDLISSTKLKLRRGLEVVKTTPSKLLKVAWKRVTKWRRRRKEGEVGEGRLPWFVCFPWQGRWAPPDRFWTGIRNMGMGEWMNPLLGNIAKWNIHFQLLLTQRYEMLRIKHAEDRILHNVLTGELLGGIRRLVIATDWRPRQTVGVIQ